ncbi:MAG: hypothetical protein ACK4MS_09980 [Paracoccaceae bacterium]
MKGWAVAMVLVAGMGSNTASTAEDSLSFDCRPRSGKVGNIESLCALFERRLAEAFPDQSLNRSASADLVLIVEKAAPNVFTARIDHRALGQGKAQGVVRWDSDLDDDARSKVIDALLASLPR